MRLALLLALALLAACGSPVEPRPALYYPTQAVPMADATGQPAPYAVTLTYCPR